MRNYIGILFASMLLLNFSCRTNQTSTTRSTKVFYSTISSGLAEAKLAKHEPYTIELVPEGIKLQGEFKLLRGGSLQWFRLPPETWESRFKQYKAMGFNAMDMYIAWNQIEPTEGQFNFDQPNIAKFLDLAQRYGIFIVIRPGPYITNEVDGGGLPAWLTRNSGKQSFLKDGKVNLRTHDPDFIEPVQRYWQKLGQILRPYYADRGGPIIIYAIENEFNWFEKSFMADKFFRYQGKPERPATQEFPAAPYMKALRDAALQAGVPVPIVTCPGDGAITAMGDVEGIVPFPNIYEWANSGQPEEIAFDLLTKMHNPALHKGIYKTFPSASLEINRSTQEMRRLLMGGLDGVFVFNIAGMIQENYLNAVTLGTRAGDKDPHWGAPDEKAPDWMGTIFDFKSFDSILTSFVSPEFGYFGNVLDYNGAISPSGVLRDLFFQFRRDNFFFNSIEGYLAASGLPKRSGEFKGADIRLKIANPLLGSREKIGMVNYWHESPLGVDFVSLLNQTGVPQKIPPNGIQFKELSLPKYTTLTVPLAEEAKRTYNQILVLHLPLSKGLQLEYSSSELLSFQAFNDETLLVVHGFKETEGELSLLAPNLKYIYGDEGVKLQENEADRAIVTYIHQGSKTAVFEYADGQRLRVIMTTTQDAGNFWFLKNKGEDIVLSGLDYIDTNSAGDLSFDFDDRPRLVQAWSGKEHLFLNLAIKQGYNPQSHMTLLEKPKTLELPSLPLLNSARLKTDHAESLPDYDDSSWVKFQGEPKAMEFLDTFFGPAWYRATINIDDPAQLKNAGRLYIEGASDFIGIYVNGTYLTTVAPMGTEIDNTSFNSSYRFGSIAPYLKKGKNVLAFRTEIWGHGSFMFSRGHLVATKAGLPSIGFDGLKGLMGQAKIGDLPLLNWTYRAAWGGQLLGYHKTELDTKSWEELQDMPKLSKGAILWYRSSFKTDDIASQDRLLAPFVLNLKGHSSKATIYFNGRLLGRWLSDNDWLQKGNWGRSQRGFWVPLSADHFPLPFELLKPKGEANVLSIAFEDTSDGDAAVGSIEAINLQYNNEGVRWTGETTELVPGVRTRLKFDLE